MSIGDIVQVLQFFIVFLIAIYFMSSIVRSFNFSYKFVKHIKEKKHNQSVILYIRNLYSANYECFHKYHIWRYSRLSW